MKRQSGILMHISSLYGDYSIGTFGKNAYEFIDFIKENGFFGVAGFAFHRYR